MNAEQIKEILDKHKKYLLHNDGGERANLQNANLQDANLQGADLQRADLQRANLQNANLQRANLQNANLQRANLQGANLQDANLKGADLQRADLRNTKLQWVNLKGVDLKGADLDFSVWPLWCGSFDVKVDKRIAVQLLYHFCRLDCDDDEFRAIKESIDVLNFANQFHRIDECGLIHQ